jgi:hypothetical protein
VLAAGQAASQQHCGEGWPVVQVRTRGRLVVGCGLFVADGDGGSEGRSWFVEPGLTVETSGDGVVLVH